MTSEKANVTVLNCTLGGRDASFPGEDGLVVQDESNVSFNPSSAVKEREVGSFLYNAERLFAFSRVFCGEDRLIVQDDGSAENFTFAPCSQLLRNGLQDVPFLSLYPEPYGCFDVYRRSSSKLRFLSS